MDVPFGLATPLLGWINDFLAGRSVRKTFVLVTAPPQANSPPSAFTVHDAVLTEVDIPDIAADSKSAAYLTLVVLPTSTTKAQATTAAPLGTKTNDYISDFSLTIKGLDTGHLQKIDRMVITSPATSDSVGTQNIAVQNKTLFPDVHLELSATVANKSSWMAWRDSFLLNGKHADSDEKDGSLVLRDTHGTTLVTLQFSHIGLIRVVEPFNGRLQTHGPAQDSLQADLYFDGLTVAGSSTSLAAAARSAQASSPTAATAASTAKPVTTASAPLYPGTTWTLTLPGGPQTWTFDSRDGDTVFFVDSHGYNVTMRLLPDGKSLTGAYDSCGFTGTLGNGSAVLTPAADPAECRAKFGAEIRVTIK